MGIVVLFLAILGILIIGTVMGVYGLAVILTGAWLAFSVVSLITGAMVVFMVFWMLIEEN